MLLFVFRFLRLALTLSAFPGHGELFYSQNRLKKIVERTYCKEEDLNNDRILAKLESLSEKDALVSLFRSGLTCAIFKGRSS